MKNLMRKLGVLGMATAGAIALGSHAKAGVETSERLLYSPELVEKVCKIAETNPYDTYLNERFWEKMIDYVFPVQEKRHVDFNCTITNGKVSSFQFYLSPQKKEDSKGYVPGEFGVEIRDFGLVGKLGSRDFFGYGVVQNDGVVVYDSFKEGRELSESSRKRMENIVAVYLDDFLRSRPDLTDDGIKIRENFKRDAEEVRKFLERDNNELKNLWKCNKPGRCWQEI